MDHRPSTFWKTKHQHVSHHQLCYSPNALTCQVGFRQGLNLAVGARGKDFRQCAFCGPSTLNQPLKKEKSQTEVNPLFIQQSAPHLDCSGHLLTVVYIWRRHQGDQKVLKISLSVTLQISHESLKAKGPNLTLTVRPSPKPSEVVVLRLQKAGRRVWHEDVRYPSGGFLIGFGNELTLRTAPLRQNLN